MKSFHSVFIILIGLLLFSCSTEEITCDSPELSMHGTKIKAYTNLEDAQSCAKETDKPILLVFDMLNGSTRKSSDLLVNYLNEKNLDDDFVVVFLYVDDKTTLESTYDAELPNGKTKTISTIGEHNTVLQISMFDLMATPYHAILDKDLKPWKEPHIFFSNTEQIEKFLTLDGNENESISHYYEVDHKINIVEQNDESHRYNIELDRTDVFLNIHFETEAPTLIIGDQSIVTELNFTYDTDLESALEGIKILKSSKSSDLIFLLPTFTEEFLTYQVVKFEADEKKFKEGLFEIDTHEYENVRGFYIDNKMELILEKDSFEVSLGDFKYQDAFSEFEN